MSRRRVLVTGASQGLGLGAAEELVREGHDVLVHVRTQERVAAVQHLVDRGARPVVGDLAVRDETLRLAEQVRDHGGVHAVIHNAGVIDGDSLLEVNVVAPHLITVLCAPTQRVVYLSSSMHRGGRPDLRRLHAGTTYSDSKLFVTTYAMAVARLVPATLSNAVDPGWVPTRMGGASAPDDLQLGHATQAWLAVSDEDEARTTGGYWHHQRREDPHAATRDPAFQDDLLTALERETGLALPV